MLKLFPIENDVDGLSVRRLLPAAEARMVGPFAFFDHMGPARMPAGQGLDVRPHPHIGLATVTWLFEGAILHRDSLGHVQRIEPGDVNWMTAGRGIVHSERSPDDQRSGPDGKGPRLHGIQTWVALPREHERCEPGFVHLPASELPRIDLRGVAMTLIAGEAFGERSPTPALSPTFYLSVALEAGASFLMPADSMQRGAYVVDGEVAVAGTALTPCTAGVLPGNGPLRIEARSAARLMLFGGDPVGERIVWWNFVASERATIEEARTRWRNGGFAAVPGETEFIPLP